jgi:KUP system potassium uptake protein
VYAPVVNWTLYAAVVGLVIGFGSSAGLASAYGIAVTGTLAIDTILFFTVVRTRWHRSLKVTLLGAAAFLTVDLVFFSANVAKIPKGGWFPLLVALIVFTVLMTWQRGRALVTEARTAVEGPLREWVTALRGVEPPVNRVPGTAIFLHVGGETTPLAMRANVEHNHTLHACAVIVSIEVQQVPYVREEERFTIDDLGYADDGITHIAARYGFSEAPDVPALLRAARNRGLEARIDVEQASFFLSRMTIQPTPERNMAGWRKKLFVVLARNAASPVDYFALPVERTVTMGSYVEF